MHRFRVFVAFCVSLNFVTALWAQEPEVPKPVEQHQWLHHFVGDWDTLQEGSAGPDQPPMKCKGTMKSQMLGEFWVVNELQGDMMGTPMKGIQTIGYDEDKKKYVGTWVDSMMNHMWNYEGSVDSTGKILTLEAEGPNFMVPGKKTKFRDAYEVKSEGLIVATSSMLGEDGKWIVFMTGTMTRQPAASAGK